MHRLRACYAVQLASARAARRADPACTGFAAYDTALCAEAAAEGFKFLPAGGP